MFRKSFPIVVGILLLTGACGKETPKAQPSDQGKKAPFAGKRRPPARKVNAGGLAVVKLWTTGSLDVPESVKYDPARKVLYVSCINGKPTEKNGKGYIAKISLVGKILKHKWATGFNAPKGMGLAGDTLWVTDIDRLHAIDTKTGRIKKTIEAPQAKFLNDIAVGPTGKVYVSDMVTGTIHVLAAGKLATVVNLKSFQGSNGMLMQGGALLVGTATGIVRVTPSDGKAAMHVGVKGFGMIDGLRAYGSHGYFMSNWKGRTQYVKRTGEVRVLVDTTPQKIQSADLEYVPGKRLLVIPTFFHNKVMGYRVR